MIITKLLLRYNVYNCFNKVNNDKADDYYNAHLLPLI